MPDHVKELERQAALRSLAHSKLTGSADGASADGSAAFAVLYELASSPATASDALKLLHELQVHQIELDLQTEELRASRIELEASLHRQRQLYDFAPVAYFTVDDRSVLHELNLAGAELLRSDHDELLGRPLNSFLTPEGTPVLRGLLARVGEGGAAERATLSLVTRDGVRRSVRAYVHPDPAGRHFLVALIDLSEGT